MNRETALGVLLAGKNVMLTGEAGSGKTHLLNEFIRISKSSGKHVSVTATTGLAATHLGGNTIHSWSGIGIANYVDENFVEKISKSRKEIIESTDILVIDEISMLHDFRLDMVDFICRLVRNDDTPFGGIQVVLAGDFFQLPPVSRGGEEARFVVHSNVWQELDPVICYLNTQYRQKGDELAEILGAMRASDLRRRHVEALQARVGIIPEEDNYTELHTTNIDVDFINQQKLKTLSGDVVEYTQTSTGAKNYVDNLSRSVLAPEVLELKSGALVMAVRNDAAKRFANGSIGQVVDFEPATDYPVVRFNNGREVTMQPETWELRDGDKKRASITQIPLRLAWAITIHKSQGMTLDAARIDLRKAFVEGMGYVALSRVRSLKSLYLHGINAMAIRISPDALNIDRDFKLKSEADAKKYADLAVDPKDFEPKKLESDKKSSSWQQKIDKMREEYPNAYKPWNGLQDDELKTLFLNGASVEKISKAMGRHQGSIKIRLQKIFGEDVII